MEYPSLESSFIPPPPQEVTYPSLKSKGLKCPTHNGSPIIGFCIDKNCKNKNKFLCVDCAFNIHHQHKVIKLKELDGLVKKKMDDIQNSKESNVEMVQAYSEMEQIKGNEIEKMKMETMLLMTIKIKEFFEDIETKCRDFLLEGKKIEDILLIENFINAPSNPIGNKIEQEIISRAYLEYYKKINEVDPEKTVIDHEDTKNKLRKLLLSKEFEQRVKQYISEQFNDFKSSLNQGFFKEKNQIKIDASKKYELKNQEEIKNENVENNTNENVENNINENDKNGEEAKEE